MSVSDPRSPRRDRRCSSPRPTHSRWNPPRPSWPGWRRRRSTPVRPATARCTWHRRSLACATCRRPGRRWGSSHAHHLPGLRHEQARLDQRSCTSLHVPTRAAGRRVPATNKPRRSSAQTVRPRHGNATTSGQRAAPGLHNRASLTIMGRSQGCGSIQSPLALEITTPATAREAQWFSSTRFICLGCHPVICLRLCSADKRYPLDAPSCSQLFACNKTVYFQA